MTQICLADWNLQIQTNRDMSCRARHCVSYLNNQLDNLAYSDYFEALSFLVFLGHEHIRTKWAAVKTIVELKFLNKLDPNLPYLFQQPCRPLSNGPTFDIFDFGINKYFQFWTRLIIIWFNNEFHYSTPHWYTV